MKKAEVTSLSPSFATLFPSSFPILHAPLLSSFKKRLRFSNHRHFPIVMRSTNLEMAHIYLRTLPGDGPAFVEGSDVSHSVEPPVSMTDRLLIKRWQPTVSDLGLN